MEDLGSLNSLLFYAIQRNNIFDVQYFLRLGADINARWFILDLTPLMFAITKKYFDIAKFLIDKGADVNLQTYHGNTALHYAIHYNEFAKYLIEKGAKKDIQNISRHTPQTLAAFIKDWEKKRQIYKIPQ
jgi:ankyrin repeat protein